MHRFFLYQIANVYLILLAGSIFGALNDAIDDPTSILSLLANSLPGVSTFFLNLLLTLLLSGVPLALLRLVPALIYRIYRSCCCGERKLTRRDLIEGPLADATVDYATLLPQFLYVLCIAVTYWVIAPFVVFVAGLVFASNYLVYKHQLCYVYVNKNETGGLFFYKLYNFSMTGLMASAVLMIVYLAIKEGVAQAPLLIPLPIVIYCVWCYTEEKFKALSTALAYDEVVRANHADTVTAVHSSNEAAVAHTVQSDFFTHPALRGDTDVSPEVYRLAGEDGTALSLFTAEGRLNDAYFMSTTVSLDDLGAALLGVRPQESVDGGTFQQSPIKHIAPDV